MPCIPEQNKSKVIPASLQLSINFLGTDSCEIVALRENFFDRQESYDSFSAKSCVFLAHGLGYISPFPYTT
jgi:hypothetical protein